MNIFLRSIFLLLTSVSIGCSWTAHPHAQAGIIGGLSGAAVGAGSGALIGAAIANGDIVASALLGGAIGLPAGVLLGVAYQYYTEESELEEKNTQIVQNYNYIVARQNQLNSLREEVLGDFQTIQIDKNERSDIYTGPTIGAYNR